MQRYRSHKIVEAAKLLEIVHVDAGEHGKELTGHYAVVEGNAGETIKLPENFGGRGLPQRGDYIVRYEPDGYVSWSPKDKFEDGYTAVD